MCSVVSVKLQQTSCIEINFEIFRSRPAETGRAVLCNCVDHVAFCKHTDRAIAFGPDNILNHKRAYILLARINCAAMASVSFILTVTTREVFLRRTSPTCITTSSKWRVPYCLMVDQQSGATPADFRTHS